ncbi:MAG: ABC transporter substrate-binding protein [Acetobacteraceae bacterium]|nr:ABC transporter substrate-binding protein [Acetobacteraceae bacterium]
MRRRDILKTALAGTAALAAPSVVRAQNASTLRFVPHADPSSLDPVWTTADITRNVSLTVFDTLYGVDKEGNPHPQMLAGATLSSDGLTWEGTLRDGLKFHDGTPVLARDAVASVNRAFKRDALGQAAAARMNEMTAPSDKTIRIRLKTKFGLLPTALSAYTTAVMPERIAGKTDANTQIPEVMGSGPYKFKADERIPGARIVFERNAAYVPRPAGGVDSFTAGPKVPHFERVVWTIMPDPATAMSALLNNEIDWWENPTIDLIPALKKDRRLVLENKDPAGSIGCLRFNHLLPPFDNVKMRQAVQTAINQRDVMEAVAGAEPSMIRVPAGLFIPGSPLANDEGFDRVAKWGNIELAKKQLAEAGYKGERIVVLSATSIPSIWAEAQVANDVLKRMGLNIDVVAVEWGTVVQRRASTETIDKGGWNIFYTYLGGAGNLSPASMSAARGNGRRAWFGWPDMPKMEALRDKWFEAPDMAAQKALVRQMQALAWDEVPYVNLGSYVGVTGYFNYLKGIRDGFPQMYGVRRG